MFAVFRRRVSGVRIGGAIVCAACVFIAATAGADDLTISNEVTAPVKTSEAANGTPGNINITAAGSVSVSTVTDDGDDNTVDVTNAVTLDSDGKTVTNSGTIENLVPDNAVGVRIVGGIAGGFTNFGTIELPGASGPPSLASGQYGVLLDGDAPFVGNIVSAAGSSISVNGVNGYGVSIQSALDGSLTFGGSVVGNGFNTFGVSLTAPVTGSFTNTGTISTDSGDPHTTYIHGDPASPVALTRDLGGGFLNGPQGAIETTGGAPAVLIDAPSFDPQDLTIGFYPDAVDPGFSFLNRGMITADGVQAGVDATAVQIGIPSNAVPNYTTEFIGSLFNSGTIAATATSDNALSTEYPETEASAIALRIGSGAIVPSIVNSGGTISATTGGPLGGIAIGLLIQDNAEVPGLANLGMLSANAMTTDPTIGALTAVAFRDLSGTLVTLYNSGTMSATATPLEDGTVTTIAADFTLSTSPITFTNVGTVLGNVLFGSAAGNTFVVSGPNASFSGVLSAAGSGDIDLVVSQGGAGGRFETMRARELGALTVGSGGIVDLLLSQDMTAVLRAKEAASFDGGSRIFVHAAALPADGRYFLVHSDTSLSFGNLGATTSTIDVPFLFNGTVGANSNDLYIDIARKSVAQLGLTGNAAKVFDPAATAAVKDATFGAALAGLNTSAEVQAVMDQMTPNAGNVAREMGVMLTDSATGSVGSRQRALQLAPASSMGAGLWTRGFFNSVSSTRAAGHDSDGTGGTLGMDWIAPEGGHFGAAVNYFGGDATENASPTTKTDVSWTIFSLYMGFQPADIFVNAHFDGGYGKIRGKRTVNVGPVTRNVVTSDWTSTIGSFGLTAGYNVDAAGLQIQPLVSLDGATFRNSVYRETGGGEGVNLIIGDNDQQSLRTFGGVMIGNTFNFDMAEITPRFLTGLSQEFLDSPSDVTAAFRTAPSSTFTVPASSVPGYRIIAGGSLDLAIANFMFGVEYNAAFGANNVSQSGKLTARAAF